MADMAGAGVDAERPVERPVVKFHFLSSCKDQALSLQLGEQRREVELHGGVLRLHVSGLYTPSKKNKGLGLIGRLPARILKYMLTYVGFSGHILLSTVSHGARRLLRQDSFVRLHLEEVAVLFPQRTYKKDCTEKATSCFKMTNKEFKFLSKFLALPESIKTHCRNSSHHFHWRGDQIKPFEYHFGNIQQLYPQAGVKAGAAAGAGSAASVQRLHPLPLIDYLVLLAVLFPDHRLVSFGKRGTTAMNTLKGVLQKRELQRQKLLQRLPAKRAAKLSYFKGKIKDDHGWHPACDSSVQERLLARKMEIWDIEQRFQTEKNRLDLSYQADLQHAQNLAAMHCLVSAAMSSQTIPPVSTKRRKTST